MNIWEAMWAIVSARVRATFDDMVAAEAQRQRQEAVAPSGASEPEPVEEEEPSDDEVLEHEWHHGAQAICEHCSFDRLGTPPRRGEPGASAGSSPRRRGLRLVRSDSTRRLVPGSCASCSSVTWGRRGCASTCGVGR